MGKTKISDGLVHKSPVDLSVAITQTKKISDLWESLTPMNLYVGLKMPSKKRLECSELTEPLKNYLKDKDDLVAG